MNSTSGSNTSAQTKKEKSIAVARNAAVGLVSLVLLIALDFTYQVFTKGPAEVSLIEVFEVPFDLIMLTVSLLVGAALEGYTAPRDWPWAALTVGIILIFLLAAAHAYMNATPELAHFAHSWNHLLTVYVPDGIGLGTLVWATFGIRG